MANFVNEAVKSTYIDLITKLREDIGRIVTLKLPDTNIDCPNCGFDAVKNRSNNLYAPDSPYPSGGVGPNNIVGPVDFPALNMRYCPVCNGKGQVVLSGNDIGVNCLINPLTPDDAEKTPLGKKYILNYEVQTSIDFLDDFKKADRLVIDGSVCYIKGIVPAGIGDLSQIIVYAGAPA